MSRSKVNSLARPADGMSPGGLVDAEVGQAEAGALAPLPRARRRRRRSLWPLWLLLVVGAGAGYGGWRWWWSQKQVAETTRSIYTVRRGDLPIAITEGGSLKALTAEVYKCEVEGSTTIISLVPEGTVISEEDVEKGKVLVELDSAELRERLTQQEITYANAESTYEAAKEDHAITKSEGESNIKNGELNVKFGRMDLEQYVGQALCTDALSGKVDLLKLADGLFRGAREQRQELEGELAKALKEVDAALAAPAEDTATPPSREQPLPAEPGDESDRFAGVSQPERDERVGGQSLQAKRKHEADIELAIEKFKRAADEVVWTARLAKRGFVSQNELEADQLALKSSVIDLQQALSARELFLRYEFPKKAEEFLSIYLERGKELDRVNARARAALAQAGARLKSAEATYLVQKAKFEKLTSQVDNCMIRATKPGLVVYATTGGHYRSRGEPIEEGSTVRERQEIIKLPDISTLAVAIKVHESVVDKVKVELRATIRIDAFPNMRLTGKVNRVSSFPDASSRWLNPDLKQYETDVSIDGVHANLKPGMSAEVEIRVDTRNDVLQVPVQAVTGRRGKSVVYLVQGEGEEERAVELGESNDKFVEVVQGVAEGDRILLEAPQTMSVEQEEEGEDEREGEEGEKEDAVGPPSPPGPSPGGPREMRPKGGAVGKGRDGEPRRRRPGGAPGKRPPGAEKGGKRPAGGARKAPTT